MTSWQETSYPVPEHALRVSCLSCGTTVAGAVRGSGNIRSILKEIKAHDDVHHDPYDPQVIGGVVQAVEQLNGGALAPRRVGRLAIEFAAQTSDSQWHRRAEVLEQRIGVLVDHKGALEQAVVKLMHERNRAVKDRDVLRARLVEAQKEIDVLRGIREALGAELRKAHPSRGGTGMFAELAKAATSAVVASLIGVAGAQWAAGLDDTERVATSVIEHADVVIADCHSGNRAGPP